jgi:hypothetical protein
MADDPLSGVASSMRGQRRRLRKSPARGGASLTQYGDGTPRVTSASHRDAIAGFQPRLRPLGPPS